MKIIDVGANKKGKYNETSIAASTCNCGACSCNCGSGGCISKEIRIKLNKKIASVYSYSN